MNLDRGTFTDKGNEARLAGHVAVVGVAVGAVRAQEMLQFCKAKAEERRLAKEKSDV